MIFLSTLSVILYLVLLIHIYSSKEWKYVATVKRDWYYKAEIFYRSFMCHGAENFLFNSFLYYVINSVIG